MDSLLIKQVHTDNYKYLSNSVKLHLNVLSVSYLLPETNLIWLMHPFNIHYSRIGNCMETKRSPFLIKSAKHRSLTKVQRSTLYHHLTHQLLSAAQPTKIKSILQTTFNSMLKVVNLCHSIRWRP